MKFGLPDSYACYSKNIEANSSETETPGFKGKPQRKWAWGSEEAANIYLLINYYFELDFYSK